MPMFTYTPNWEAVRNFFGKMERFIPTGYTGFAAIRLHRTGNPLGLEILGPELPERTLYPLILLEFKSGKMVMDWPRLQDQHEVPWARPSDFHAFRVDVMSAYHAEDLLEANAEEILKTGSPSEEMLKKSLIDGAAVTA